MSRSSQLAVGPGQAVPGWDICLAKCLGFMFCTGVRSEKVFSRCLPRSNYWLSVDPFQLRNLCQTISSFVLKTPRPRCSFTLNRCSQAAQGAKERREEQLEKSCRVYA